MSKENNISMDQAVAFFESLDDRSKRTFLRRIGVTAFVHKVNGRDVYPSNAGFLGRAIPTMANFMTAQEKAFGHLANQNVDIANPAIIDVLSEKTYFRPLDDNDQPIGDEPGIVEAWINQVRTQTDALYAATREAWVKPKHKTRRGRPDNKAKTAKAAAEKKSTKKTTAKASTAKKDAEKAPAKATTKDSSATATEKNEAPAEA